MSRLLLVCLFVIFAFVLSEEAKLVFYKTKVSERVFEGQDLIISYKLINIGDGPAYGIEVSDDYDRQSFLLTSHERPEEESSGNPGEENNKVIIQFPDIPPQESHAVNVTVVPQVSGVFTPGLAEVKYSGGADVPLEDEDDEDEEETMDLDEASPEKEVETGRIGRSNLLNRIRINPKTKVKNEVREFAEWAAFAILCVLTTATPYLKSKKDKQA